MTLNNNNPEKAILDAVERNDIETINILLNRNDCERFLTDESIRNAIKRGYSLKHHDAVSAILSFINDRSSNMDKSVKKTNDKETEINNEEEKNNEEKKDVDAKMTPQKRLYEAIMKSDIKLSKMLISEGQSIDSLNNEGKAIIHSTIENKNMISMQLAIKLGADLHILTEGKNLLDFALDNDNLDAFKFLLGEDKLFGSKILPKMRYNALKKLPSARLNLLLTCGPSVDTRYKNDDTLLHLAARLNCIDHVDILISKGARLQLYNKHGDLPIHIAAHNGYVEIMKKLHDSSKVADIKNRNGLTILHIASKAGQVNAVKYALTLKLLPCDINQNTGDNSFHYAAESGSSDVIMELHNSDKYKSVDKQNQYEMTPLHISVKSNQIKSTETLLKIGADVNIYDENRNTPLHHAILGNISEIVSILLSSPDININVQNKNRETPLELSKKNKATEIYTLLLNHLSNSSHHTSNENNKSKADEPNS